MAPGFQMQMLLLNLWFTRICIITGTGTNILLLSPLLYNHCIGEVLAVELRLSMGVASDFIVRLSQCDKLSLRFQ